jgi:hypothetical protein
MQKLTICCISGTNALPEFAKRCQACYLLIRDGLAHNVSRCLLCRYPAFVQNIAYICPYPFVKGKRELPLGYRPSFGAWQAAHRFLSRNPLAAVRLEPQFVT